MLFERGLQSHTYGWVEESSRDSVEYPCWHTLASAQSRSVDDHVPLTMSEIPNANDMYSNLVELYAAPLAVAVSIDVGSLAPKFAIAVPAKANHRKRNVPMNSPMPATKSVAFEC